MMSSTKMPPSSKMEEILQLIASFNVLHAQPAVFMDEAALDLEKQKLKIMQDFNRILNEIIPQKKTPSTHEERFFFSLSSRKMLYYFILTFGLLESIASSYLFGSSLFSLIPGISDMLNLVASIIFTVLDSIYFYAFEVTFLKDALGIPYDQSRLTQSIETYSRQLDTTIAINQQLENIRMMTVDDEVYDHYIEFIRLLNGSLWKKQKEMQPYPESMLTTMLKIVVVVYGAISSLASSYFFANTTLNMVAASLVGTALGWILVLLTMLCGLGFYYAMGYTSMIHLVTPGLDQYQALKAGLDDFSEHYSDDDLNTIVAIRKPNGQQRFFRPCLSAKEDEPPILASNRRAPAPQACDDTMLDQSQLLLKI